MLYLDYGNKEKVMVTELRTLPQTFKLLPPQAACCALAEASTVLVLKLTKFEFALRFL